MLYATIEQVKEYRMCSDGPKIHKHFSQFYGPTDLIPGVEILDKFGATNTVFCLRAIKGGPEFAVKCAITSAARALPRFQEQFPGNTIAEDAIIAAGRRIAGDLDASVCRTIGKQCEEFCMKQLNPEQDKARKAGMAAARTAYSAYALHVPSTCVDYAIGACEDSCMAADDPTAEEQWQVEGLRMALLNHTEA